MGLFYFILNALRITYCSVSHLAARISHLAVCSVQCMQHAVCSKQCADRQTALGLSMK